MKPLSLLFVYRAVFCSILFISLISIAGGTPPGAMTSDDDGSAAASSGARPLSAAAAAAHAGDDSQGDDSYRTREVLSSSTRSEEGDEHDSSQGEHAHNNWADWDDDGTEEAEGDPFSHLPSLRTRDDRVAFLTDFMNAFVRDNTRAASSTSSSAPSLWQRALVKALVLPPQTGDIKGDLLRFVPQVFHNKTFLDDLARIHGFATMSFRYPMQGPIVQLFGLPYLNEMQKDWVSSDNYALFQTFASIFLGHNAAVVVEKQKAYVLTSLHQIIDFFESAHQMRSPLQELLTRLFPWAGEIQAGVSNDLLLDGLLDSVDAVIQVLNEKRPMPIPQYDRAHLKTQPRKEIYQLISLVFSSSIVTIPPLETISGSFVRLRTEMGLVGFSTRHLDPIEALLRHEFSNISSYVEMLRGVEKCLKSLADGSDGAVPCAASSERDRGGGFDAAMRTLRSHDSTFQRTLTTEAEANADALSKSSLWAPYAGFLNLPYMFPIVMAHATDERKRGDRSESAANDLLQSEAYERRITSLQREIGTLKDQLRAARAAAQQKGGKQRNAASAATSAPTAAAHSQRSEHEESLVRERDKARASLQEREEEVRHLRASLEQLNREFESLQQRNRALDGIAYNAEKRASAAEEKLRTQRGRQAERARQEQLDAASRRAREAETRMHAAEKALVTLRDQITSLHSQLREMESLKKALEETRARLSASQAEREASENHVRYMVAQQEASDRLYHALHARHESLVQSAAQQQQELSERNRGISNLSRHNKTLASKVSQLESQLRKSIDLYRRDTASLGEESTKSRFVLDVTQQENMRLRARIRALEEELKARHAETDIFRTVSTNRRNRMDEVDSTALFAAAFGPIAPPSHVAAASAAAAAASAAAASASTDYQLWGAPTMHEEREGTPTLLQAISDAENGAADNDLTEAAASPPTEHVQQSSLPAGSLTQLNASAPNAALAASATMLAPPPQPQRAPSPLERTAFGSSGKGADSSFRQRLRAQVKAQAYVPMPRPGDQHESSGRESPRSDGDDGRETS